jgi:RNA polymerase sigma factor (sigma-70 family)
MKRTPHFVNSLFIDFLRKHNLSQKQFAYLCNLSIPTINNICQFKNMPSEESKKQIISRMQQFDPSITSDKIFPKKYYDIFESLKISEPPEDIEFVRIDEIKNQPTSDDNFEEIDRKDLYNCFLKDVLSVLNKHQKIILFDYFFKEKSLDEIAKKIKLSSSRVQKMKERLLRKLFCFRFKEFEHLEISPTWYNRSSFDFLRF